MKQLRLWRPTGEARRALARRAVYLSQTLIHVEPSRKICYKNFRRLPNLWVQAAPRNESIF
jgi:hypothetical protein